MERKECIKYIAVVSLSFASLVMLKAQLGPDERVYQAYISDQMGDWDGVIVELSQRRSSLSDEQLGKLINYYYGYTGWLTEEGPKKKANRYIEEADEIIDELMAKYPENPDLYAYKGAFFGFKIGMSPVKAPFLGPESINHIDQALELGPNHPQGWIERGNALFYMPKMFGGSKAKALDAYKKAIQLMEKDAAKLKNNWMYLNVLMILGQSYEKTGDLQMAKSTYEKVLEIEPQFTYMSEELYPSLLEKWEAQK
jgi:tetratricopeptide (TPR) repeat protein